MVFQVSKCAPLHQGLYDNNVNRLEVYQSSRPMAHVYAFLLHLLSHRKAGPIYLTMFPMGPMQFPVVNFSGKVQGRFYMQGSEFLDP